MNNNEYLHIKYGQYLQSNLGKTVQCKCLYAKFNAMHIKLLGKYGKKYDNATQYKY